MRRHTRSSGLHAHQWPWRHGPPRPKGLLSSGFLLLLRARGDGVFVRALLAPAAGPASAGPPPRALEAPRPPCSLLCLGFGASPGPPALHRPFASAHTCLSLFLPATLRPLSVLLRLGRRRPETLVGPFLALSCLLHWSKGAQTRQGAKGGEKDKTPKNNTRLQ